MKKPGLGRLGLRQGEKGQLMASTVDCYIPSPKSQNTRIIVGSFTGRCSACLFLFLWGVPRGD